MNLIVLERIIDRFGRRYYKSEIFAGEAGARGERGDKGEQGVGITGAILSASGLVFSMSDNSTANVGKVAPASLEMANMGEINGENTTLFIEPFQNPKFLAINGVLYHDSEYQTDGITLTTTFPAGDEPEGDVTLIYKEAM